MGALQIPPDGYPILLMAERPTTGGYPKVATVISADLSQAAQLQRGDTVTFRASTMAEAEAALLTHGVRSRRRYREFYDSTRWKTPAHTLGIKA
jgi:allophanate hydrolase subunit 2